jgi:hypothetical protein
MSQWDEVHFYGITKADRYKKQKRGNGSSTLAGSQAARRQLRSRLKTFADEYIRLGSSKEAFEREYDGFLNNQQKLRREINRRRGLESEQTQ